MVRYTWRSNLHSNNIQLRTKRRKMCVVYDNGSANMVETNYAQRIEADAYKTALLFNDTSCTVGGL